MSEDGPRLIIRGGERLVSPEVKQVLSKEDIVRVRQCRSLGSQQAATSDGCIPLLINMIEAKVVRDNLQLKQL
ncbi:hypothetical protein TSUD_258240 [Trifolium subterraneum]|uniref:Uncharacterized protein n=1 Tax=Trifolium subterraneum TaxID=3900 RepID=A0A2Z6N8M2_TRISU|nr:hypothetical protein TSUD_258240 [Trifolium subterraneum]